MCVCQAKGAHYGPCVCVCERLRWQREGQVGSVWIRRGGLGASWVNGPSDH